MSVYGGNQSTIAHSNIKTYLLNYALIYIYIYISLTSRTWLQIQSKTFHCAKWVLGNLFCFLTSRVSLYRWLWPNHHRYTGNVLIETLLPLLYIYDGLECRSNTRTHELLKNGLKHIKANTFKNRTKKKYLLASFMGTNTLLYYYI